ncbi:hypothetical protein [Streptomyces sp. ID05-47C]|uniref:hypothetical protein n=1 Tax=Streptomyces sp. ID05-47C TaxID=3028665 RepID=UPI0029B93F96|nr:hypothetical protein [Streptomyces sp. ID05-47C]MDX3569916.1 hypothetical protein [Streptomyces sp. ID05-47C]
MVAQEPGGDEDGLDHADVLIFQMLLYCIHVGARRQQASALIDVVSNLLRAVGGRPLISERSCSGVGLAMSGMLAVLEARRKAAAVRVEELEAEPEPVRTDLADAEEVLRRRVIGLEQYLEALRAVP